MFLCWRSMNSKDAGRPRPTHHQGANKMKWNETKWIRWVWRNGGMKLVAEENGRNPEKNLPRLRFFLRNPHGVTETRIRNRSNGGRASKCLHHGAAYKLFIDSGHLPLDMKNKTKMYLHYRPWRPTEDVDARFHIFSATALGGGWLSSPTLGRLYPGKVRYSFYKRLSEPQDQSRHEVVKKNHQPFAIQDRTRAV